MTELSNEMVQRRFETVASGSYQPEIPVLPGLVFVKMDLKAKGASSRAYNAKLQELRSDKTLFYRAYIPRLLDEELKDMGINREEVLKKHKALMKRIFDTAPADLISPYDNLTEEEVAQLPHEEQKAREEALVARGQRVGEYLADVYTEEDNEILRLMEMIQQREKELFSQTKERMAEKHQAETEILLCSRKAESIDEPYFKSLEEIQFIELTNHQGLVKLYLKWAQFRNGMAPDFFSPSSSGARNGSASGGLQ